MLCYAMLCKIHKCLNFPNEELDFQQKRTKLKRTTALEFAWKPPDSIHILLEILQIWCENASFSLGFGIDSVFVRVLTKR